MSYELCVLDAQLAPTREAAYNAWNETTYLDISQPENDRAAPKWRIRQALEQFNPRLEWNEPKAAATGVLASFMKKTSADDDRRALVASLPLGDEATSFYVFDQAVEIELPWEAEPGQVEAIVREVWRHLEVLSQCGLSAIYDTERDVMLNLETDFDAVVQGYRKNLSDEDDAPAAEHAPSASSANDAPQARESSPSPADQPFTGNAQAAKPWWKIW